MPVWQIVSAKLQFSISHLNLFKNLKHHHKVQALLPSCLLLFFFGHALQLARVTSEFKMSITLRQQVHM